MPRPGDGFETSIRGREPGGEGPSVSSLEPGTDPGAMIGKEARAEVQGKKALSQRHTAGAVQGGGSMALLIRSKCVEVKRGRPVLSADGRCGGDPRRGGRRRSLRGRIAPADAGQENS
jgi:hypothetical protein